MEAEKGTAWSLEFGAWSLELGVWRLEFGAWSLELGAWRLVFGVWMEFAMLWGRGGGRGPWAGSRTGQPQRSTGSKGQLIRITCAIKMITPRLLSEGWIRSYRYIPCTPRVQS